MGATLPRSVQDEHISKKSYICRGLRGGEHKPRGANAATGRVRSHARGNIGVAIYSYWMGIEGYVADISL